MILESTWFGVEFNFMSDVFIKISISKVSSINRNIEFKVYTSANQYLRHPIHFLKSRPDIRKIHVLRFLCHNVHVSNRIHTFYPLLAKEDLGIRFHAGYMITQRLSEWTGYQVFYPLLEVNNAEYPTDSLNPVSCQIYD